MAGGNAEAQCVYRDKGHVFPLQTDLSEGNWLFLVAAQTRCAALSPASASCLSCTTGQAARWASGDIQAVY